MAGILPVTIVPGEASVVAVATLITEALKLTQMVIADQTAEEKVELGKLRVNFLRMANQVGDYVVAKLQLPTPVK